MRNAVDPVDEVVEHLLLARHALAALRHAFLDLAVEASVVLGQVSVRRDPDLVQAVQTSRAEVRALLRVSLNLGLPTNCRSSIRDSSENKFQIIKK